MKLKTPLFWYRDSDTAAPAIENILSPLSCGYALAYTLHQNSKKPARASVPVICIGNLVAGGTGKTPTAITLLKLLKSRGMAQNPFFLIRGYGGGERGPLAVDLNKHTAWETGDEALMLAREAPTIVSADRAAGAALAVEHGADLILMDDGLQNPGIKKDLKIVVINGDMGFGNLKMLPAGPLREPLLKGLERADAFILIGEDKRNILGHLPGTKPVICGSLQSTNKDTLPASASFIAFAGLGYPDKFFQFLTHNEGLNIVETVSYPDHYPYNREDMKALKAKAADRGAALLTTEKDFLRVPDEDKDGVYAIHIDMVWNNEDILVSLLKDTLGRTA